MNNINTLLSYFDDEMQAVFNMLDAEIMDRINEIRVRANKPLILVIKNTSYFIDNNGDIYDYVTHNAVVISNKQLEKLYLSLCEYSIYSNMENLKNGYITIQGGFRIGIASTAVYDDFGNLSSIKNISSINIRIPRQAIGCSNQILNSLYINSFPSIIIAGMPNSGKTTLLRDIAFQLSNGFNNEYKKIAVVDERNEIAGKDELINTLETGINTDVLTCFSKQKGIEMATRVLSPEMIICDEIATVDELNSIKFAFSCGVSFAVSVHVKSKEDLYNKEIIKQLVSTNEFSYIVLLNGFTYNTEIIDVAEVYNEIYRNACFDSIIDRIGIPFLQGSKGKS